MSEKSEMYLVLVCDHVRVSVSGQSIKPLLPDGIAGYAPIYTDKKMAMKDWPNREIMTLEKVSKSNEPLK